MVKIVEDTVEKALCNGESIYKRKGKEVYRCTVDDIDNEDSKRVTLRHYGTKIISAIGDDTLTYFKDPQVHDGAYSSSDQDACNTFLNVLGFTNYVTRRNGSFRLITTKGGE